MKSRSFLVTLGLCSVFPFKMVGDGVDGMIYIEVGFGIGDAVGDIVGDEVGSGNSNVDDGDVDVVGESDDMFEDMDIFEHIGTASKPLVVPLQSISSHAHWGSALFCKRTQLGSMSELGLIPLTRFQG